MINQYRKFVKWFVGKPIEEPPFSRVYYFMTGRIDEDGKSI